MVPLTRLTVPPWLLTALRPVTVRVWEPSLAGPSLSFERRSVAGKLNTVSSAMILVSAKALGGKNTTKTFTGAGAAAGGGGRRGAAGGGGGGAAPGGASAGGEV